MGKNAGKGRKDTGSEGWQRESQHDVASFGLEMKRSLGGIDEPIGMIDLARRG